MAIAKQTAGVTFGYKPKVKKLERRKPTLLQRIAASCILNAREMREFVVDEIVYETMDTIRLFQYLRYEFGWKQGRRRTADRGVRSEFPREATPSYANFFQVEQVAVEPVYSDQR